MRHSNLNAHVQQINLNEPLTISNDTDLENAFHFWHGATGKRYIHSVYTIFDCPELPNANYILVSRQQDGSCKALSIGELKENATSLNLAFLRHNAAKLSANEIHIHVMTKNKYERNMVRLDLLGCQTINGQQSK